MQAGTWLDGGRPEADGVYESRRVAHVSTALARPPQLLSSGGPVAPALQDMMTPDNTTRMSRRYASRQIGYRDKTTGAQGEWRSTRRVAAHTDSGVASRSTRTVAAANIPGDET